MNSGRRNYVRLTGVRDNRFIEFNFSMGDPTIYLEMILPVNAFNEFCSQHNVLFVDAHLAARIDKDEEKWYSGKDPVEYLSVIESNQ